MNFASSAYRIVSVGYETSVKAYKATWETAQSGKKYQAITHCGTDSVLPYADIVMLDHHDTFAPYETLLGWYTSCRGMGRTETTKAKPAAKLARLGMVRVYWYPIGSYGHDNRNYGMRHLLEQLKVSDQEKYKAVLARGDKDTAAAFKILSRIKSLHDDHHPLEGHLTSLSIVRFVPSLGRTAVVAVKDSHSYRWLKGATPYNRSKFVWSEEIHGVAIEKYLDYLEQNKGHDENSLEGMFDDDDEEVEAIEASPMAQALPEEVAKPSFVRESKIASTKIIASIWDLQGNFGELKLPDGSTIDESDQRWDEMCKAYHEQEKETDNEQ